MNLREILKEKTRDLHVLAESVLNLQSIQTPADYTRMLRNFWNFYVNFETEARTEAADRAPFRFYFQGRAKANHLKEDLQFLTNQEPSITRIDRWNFRDWSDAQIWGFLYVVEGSSLGGQIITKELKDRFHFEDQGLHFFGGYGNQPIETLPIGYYLQRLTHEYGAPRSPKLNALLYVLLKKFDAAVQLEAAKPVKPSKPKAAKAAKDKADRPAKAKK